MGKFDELSHFIIENVGGKDNIIGLTHCMTRLRFTLNDYSLANESKLKENKEIATAQKAGGQYQVVIGTHVGDVYTAILEKIGAEKSVESSEKKSVLNSIIEIITKVITPILGILLASGLIQGLLMILTFAGLLQETDGAYFILNAMGQAIFNFFPVILGYTSAKAFKLDPAIGIIIGAIIIFPGMVENLANGDAIITLFEGSFVATPVYQTFFGIPVMFPAMGYGSTVIPIIFIVFFASKINHFLKNKIPAVMAFTLVPFLTILLTIPISLLAIGPITNMLSELISNSISALYGFSTIFTSFIVALIYQPLVILGLHWPLITLGLQNLGLHGSDYILPTLFTASFAQAAVVAAVYFRTQAKTQKEIAVPAFISALFCIIEPAIYGVTLQVKKRFVFSMLGGAIGGTFISAFGADMYAGVVGIFGFVSFLNPNGEYSGLIISIVGVLISIIISFLLTYLIFDKKIEPKTEEAVHHKKSGLGEKLIYSPLKGNVTKLENATDSAFANGLLGKGILFYPEGNQVVAPFDGMITTVFPTGHAVGITSTDGVEMLVHVGKDTVRLEGQYFKKLKEQGDLVKKGEAIVEFNLEAIKKEKFSIETPVVITNSDKYANILITGSGFINYTDELISIQLNSGTSVLPKDGGVLHDDK
ncbi:PTS beta-glucoside transporter subunit EIIBCA [Robertmurraya siralis]|uniref:PTS beta-glucoside transporter subunit EIIBCA n=1 Tax=Robertmurraya siralis TaxID=77777 RepID=A0A920BV94_9BACI|nr:beta-glucoside-specific PTS transporter subunit IIABC [Robertmurraya siralis]GIN63889.1 PTS beta-glucoside transporter subunit EIIBCA [Robertmurraya siralis]